MIKTYCDICKKQIGVEVSRPGQFYAYTPCDNGYYTTFAQGGHDHVCCECEGELREAVNDAVEKIRSRN